MLERCSGDNGREARQFRKLKDILAKRTGSTKDDNRISDVLPSALGSYRLNQPNAIWIFIVQTDISRPEANRESGGFVVGNIGRNLRNSSSSYKCILLKSCISTSELSL